MRVLTHGAGVNALAEAARGTTPILLSGGEDKRTVRGARIVMCTYIRGVFNDVHLDSWCF